MTNKEKFYADKKEKIRTERLTDIYEIVFGDDGITRYTHDELKDKLNEMYDCYLWMCEYGNELKMKDDLYKGGFLNWEKDNG
jgi:GH15 family glucan-1,4-alpha-glucosidase